jgi:hypothetical protein
MAAMVRTRDSAHTSRAELDVLHHPLHAAEHEIEHLWSLAAEGESAATPVILIGTWIAVVVPLVLAVVGIALVVAYLITR